MGGELRMKSGKIIASAVVIAATMLGSSDFVFAQTPSGHTEIVDGIGSSGTIYIDCHNDDACH